MADIQKEHGTDYPPFLPVIAAAEKLAALGRPAVLAIDGRCGSGKTALAGLLTEAFSCNVFHMDDFFLPMELRTKERLSLPGGNIDRKRFAAEILRPIAEGHDICYRPFDCQAGTLRPEIRVSSKPLSVVEGSYSLHPDFRDFYDFSVFLTVSSEVQQLRILRRNGKAALRRFTLQWIPLEERYFKACLPDAVCDLIIDTSGLFTG